MNLTICPSCQTKGQNKNMYIVVILMIMYTIACEAAAKSPNSGK